MLMYSSNTHPIQLPYISHKGGSTSPQDQFWVDHNEEKNKGLIGCAVQGHPGSAHVLVMDTDKAPTLQKGKPTFK